MPDFHLDGANPAWEQVVADLYGLGLRRKPEIASCRTVKLADRARSARSEAGRRCRRLVTSNWPPPTIGPDAIYGVDDGSGFRIVAARLSSIVALRGRIRLVRGRAQGRRRGRIGCETGRGPESSRADSIHLVALDGLGHGGVLGIPRDSWVRISGGGMSKINASLSTGGPAVMLQTVADVTGLNLDGYVLTGFTGFQEMVGNVLGGVDIELPAAGHRLLGGSRSRRRTRNI